MVKPKLLVLELWGIGDLVIATPFLQAAGGRYDVTLLAKPYALDLKPHFWPSINVVPFVAPWTAFHGKYRLLSWPWREMFRLRRLLAREQFDAGVSIRPDPRDHVLLKLIGAKDRLGFPRAGSQVLLTRALAAPDAHAHRYENWRSIGKALGLNLPPQDQIPMPARPEGRVVLIHTGAAQPVRVWPLDRYRCLAQTLRAQNYEVRILCDPDQRDWWLQAGERAVAPQSIPELLALLADAAVFIGNDSGPGHLAALRGLPTFTFFGPQVPERFAPLHLEAVWTEPKPCPYWPCKDYCRFPEPHCLSDVTEAEVWPKLEEFLERHLGKSIPVPNNMRQRF
jgi:ADP-heptose:LPS heptosyltransferase